jgi:hypothetical protein
LKDERNGSGFFHLLKDLDKAAHAADDRCRDRIHQGSTPVSEPDNTPPEVLSAAKFSRPSVAIYSRRS